MKIQMAQQKGAVMKKARDKARAKGLSPEDEKAAVQAAIKKFEEEFMAAAGAAPAAAPAKPVDDRAAKMQTGAGEGGVITKARAEARAKGVSPRKSGRSSRRRSRSSPSSRRHAAAAPRPRPRRAAPAPMDRAAKVQLAQAKAAVITKAREEARAKGMSPRTSRKLVAEALKKFSEEQKDSHGDRNAIPGERELETIDINVNVGPQHPATHGVFRMVISVDGEIVKDLDPVIGYMHRGNEKLPENLRLPAGNRLSTTARTTWRSSTPSIATSRPSSSLAGITPPERARVHPRDPGGD